MRIIWNSNAPWAASGYGVQTKLFAPRIKHDLGHDVAIVSLYGLEGGVQVWKDIPVFPKMFHQYGLDATLHHAQGWQADLIVTLIDAWVMDGQQLESVAPWAPWFPVDSDPVPAAVARQVQHARFPLVFSRHAERAVKHLGLSPRYVPHGFDGASYNPGDKTDARKRLGLPEDAFVVGIVAANKGTPARKCWPQQLEAFAELRRHHPDAMLYLHTHLGPQIQGINIPEVCEFLGIPKSAIRACDQTKNMSGLFGDDYMADVYRAMDVLSNVTMGEGFGVPILEAQACGTPVIVGGWTAMQELGVSGWQVPRERAERFWVPVGAHQYIPHTRAIYECMEAAYQTEPEDPAKVAEAVADYEADNVTEKYWRPVLDEIERALEDAVEAPEVVAA